MTGLKINIVESVFGQILNVGSGYLGARALSFLNTFIAITVFGQDAFGELAVFIAVTTLISAINLLTLDKTLPTADDETAKHMVLALCAQVFVSAFIPLLLGPMLNWKYPEFMGVLIIATGLNSIGLAINVRQRKFIWMSVSTVLPVIIFFIFLCVCWYSGVDETVWLLGGSAGSFFLAALIYALAIIFPFVKGSKFSMPAITEVYRKEKVFMLQVTCGNFCNRGAFYLPTVIIADRFGIDVAAQYALMLQICMLPMGLVEGAVGKVYQAHLAAMVRTGAYSDLARRQIKLSLALFSVLFLLLCYWLVPFVVGLVLKGDWSLALQFIYIVAPAFALMTFVSPLTVAFFVFKLGKVEMLGQLLWFIGVMAAMGVGVLRDDIIEAVILVSAVTAMRLMVLYFYAERRVTAWQLDNAR